MLFLQASSALLHPYQKFVHSAAPVAKVSSLATVRGLLIMRAVQRYFTVCLAERLVAGLFGIIAIIILLYFVRLPLNVF